MTLYVLATENVQLGGVQVIYPWYYTIQAHDRPQGGTWDNHVKADGAHPSVVAEDYYFTNI